MRFCKKRLEWFFGFLPALFCAFALVFGGGAARAAEVKLEDIRLESRSMTENAPPDSFILSARAQMKVSERLEDIVRKGVPLTFVWEFTLERPRWYWKNEALAEKRQVWKLSYHALTQQYRLTSDALHQTFPTLEAALFLVTRARGWVVAEGGLPAGAPLTARLRFRLDNAQLPALFQAASSFGGKDLDLDSGWISWQWTPSAAPEEKNAL